MRTYLRNSPRGATGRLAASLLVAGGIGATAAAGAGASGATGSPATAASATPAAAVRYGSDVSQVGRLSTLAGSPGSGRGVYLSQQPVALGRSGSDVLVVDAGSATVRDLASNGTETVVVGTTVPSYNGDGRPALTASLDDPAGVAKGPAGVFVSDTFSYRIRYIPSSNCSSACPYGLGSVLAGYVYTVAGDGSQGLTGNSGQATKAGLGGATAITVDPRGDLIIADLYTPQVRLVAMNSCSTGCPYGLGSMTAGDIYAIAGNGVQHGYGGNGGPGTAAQLNAPDGLAVDSSGDLLIADGNSNEVRLLANTNCSAGCPYGLASTTAGYIYLVAGSSAGASGYSGDGGSATAATLDTPAGLTIGAGGDLLIADSLNDVIRLVAGSDCSSGCPYGLSSTTTGDIYTVAGSGPGSGGGYGGDGGPATAAEMQQPTDAVVDGNGNLLIADSGNDRVRMVAASSCGSGCAYGLGSTTAGDIYTVAGTGSPSYSGNGELSLQAELNDPAGAAVDSNGNLAIANASNGRIGFVPSRGCSSGCPFGISSMQTDGYYNIAGNGSLGYGGDGGPALSAELDQPHGVAVLADGDIVVADTHNNRIRLVAAVNCSSACPYGLSSTHAGYIYTIAGIGSPGNTGNGGPARSAKLQLPYDVSLGPEGSLIVADSGNNSLRIIDGVGCRGNCPYHIASMEPGNIYDVGGTGQFGFSGDGGPATSATFAIPRGITVATNGDLIVADSMNNRIRLISDNSCTSSCVYGLASTAPGDVYTIAGNGGYGFAGDGAAAKSAVFGFPQGVEVDSAGNVYVADEGNLRVRMVENESCSSSCPFGLRSMSPGIVQTLVGNGKFETAPDVQPAATVPLAGPLTVGPTPLGGVVIVETGHGAIRILTTTPQDGYFVASSSGAVYNYGGPYYGSMAGHQIPAPVVGIADDTVTGGYWLVGSNGSIYAFGGARFYGSMAGHTLNKPIVGMAATTDGRGYWLVASDGGIFSFGDARFYGSTGNLHLNKPIVGMTAYPGGAGYWFVASDGGIFTFGEAKFRGSTGNIHLNKPIVGMAADTDGYGYWLVASDGGMFTFGDAHFYGSLGSDHHLPAPITGMSVDRQTGGYRMVLANGTVYQFHANNYGTTTPSVRPAVGVASGF